MTKKLEVFALDMGNGWVKAKSSKVTLSIPSYIAKLSALGTSSIDGMAVQVPGINVFKSKLDDREEYIMGEHIKSEVEQPMALLSTFTHEKRYDKLEFKLMCEFILAELASDFEEETLDVIVVTGVPSNEIKTDDEKTFRENLKGKHLITRNGVEYVVNVVDVRILEQPLGTLMNKYVNDKLQIHQDHRDTVTVIDFGSGTTIFDTYKALKRLPKRSGTIRTGQFAIYNDVLTDLQVKHSARELTRSHIEDAFKDNYTVTQSKTNKFSCEEEAKKHVELYVESWINVINGVITSRETIDEFIITGGGYHNVGEVFKQKFGEDVITVVEDSQLANVNGFYKFGLVIVEKSKKKVK